MTLAHWLSLAAALACLAWGTVAALLRQRRDTPWRHRQTLVAVTLAIAAAMALIVSRSADTGQTSVATVFDAMVLLVAVLGLLFMATSLWARGPALGVFLLPLMLILMALAAVLQRDAAALPEGIPHAATLTHIILTVVGMAVLALACAAAIMYLAQQSRLRRGSTDRLSSQLPSLEWLEAQNRRAVAVGFVLFTVGLGLGLGLMVLRGDAVGLGFEDPKVLTSLAVWAVFAVLVAMSALRRFRGQSVARWTVAIFVLMVLVAATVGTVWRSAHVFE
jgi:ABC-type uncharacterized transport system permease subunit